MFPTPISLYDLILTPTALSSIALIVLFHISAPFFPDTKRLAWVLSTITSLTMSLTSLPFLWDYFVHRGDLKLVRQVPELALIVNRFFQAYLVTDLVVGSIYYRSKISLLAGWVHHPLYVFIVELTIRRSWANLFCLAAAMEIPTFVLGISTLFPRVRSNLLFAVSFFTFRIVFHIVLIMSLLLKANRNAVLGGSYVPATILTAVLPLHISWFVGCVKGFIRRAQGSKTGGIPSSIPIDVVGGPSPSPSSSRPSTKSSTIEITTTTTISSALPPTPFRRLRLRLTHRRQTFERALRSFRYDFLESPTSKRILITNAISPYIPRRETLYEWVGLGQRRRIRFLTGATTTTAGAAGVTTSTAGGATGATTTRFSAVFDVIDIDTMNAAGAAAASTTNSTASSTFSTTTTIPGMASG